ncbi:hypothetical protein Cfor_03708, partial [Coptotermes formosanus]
AFFASCSFIGFPSLYATLVCVACSQLEKLRLALLDIRQKHVMSEQNCNDQAQQSDVHGPAHPSDEQLRHMQEQLNNCIRHHQQIKRYMEALEDTMNLPLCGILFMFLSIMCFDALSAITVIWGDHADITQAAVVYIFATGSVCLYCWLGNELSEQAECLRDAAWGCDWVGTPVLFQRCLVFTIAAANKGFTLTAGKFVPVSNSTMMNVGIPFVLIHSLISVRSPYSYHKSDIEHLLRLTDAFTWEELPTRHPDTGYLTKAGYIPIIQTVAAYVIVLAIVYHTVQCTVRIVLNHDMIMANWYPFDASVSPMYEIANLTQALISIIILCLYFGFPSLYATLVCVACSQLEKLRAELLDIGQTHLMSEQDCGDWARQTDGPGRAHTSDEVFRHMQQKLKDCIRHHQQIKRFMEALEDTMNLPLCGILFLLLIMLCFDAFSAVTSWGDYNDISQAAVVYIFATGSVCAYCWLGNELSEQAEMIRDAAWGCDWVGTPVPFQRCLVFIIAAVNKEFTLTAGKFVPVCNKTMMNTQKLGHLQLAYTRYVEARLPAVYAWRLGIRRQEMWGLIEAQPLKYGSYKKCHVKFRINFPDAPVSFSRTCYKYVKLFRPKGFIVVSNRTCTRHAINEEGSVDISDRLACCFELRFKRECLHHKYEMIQNRNVCIRRTQRWFTNRS